MDAKLKWWERSAQARTKRSCSDDKPSAGTEEVGSAAAVGQDVRPGAVAVRGPGRREDDDDVSTVRVGEGSRAQENDNEDGTNEAPPFHVDSYAVNEGPTDEEIRQQILAGTAHAEPVPFATKSGAVRWQRWKLGALAIVFTAVAAAVAVGIAVPLSQRQSQAMSAPTVDDDVLASFTYLEWQSSGGYAYSVRAETRRSQTGGSPETSGLLEMVYCRVITCLENDENCLTGGLYSPGCCFGAECAANESKCGSYCPPSPESCYHIDPDNKTCLQPECYACHPINGQDTYVIKNTAYAIDCLEVGTAIRPENGQPYKWAIFCGPVITGPVVEENRDLGEYQCGAFRLGASYSDDDGGLQTGVLPCQYLALAECGCGPADMFTFGLPDPTGSCLPESGCPLMCEDAGPQYARNLCRSFPGNFSWWEGTNVFNSSFFSKTSWPRTTSSTSTKRASTASLESFLKYGRLLAPSSPDAAALLGGVKWQNDYRFRYVISR